MLNICILLYLKNKAISIKHCLIVSTYLDITFKAYMKASHTSGIIADTDCLEMLNV
jgi:hypothetical protein